MLKKIFLFMLLAVAINNVVIAQGTIVSADGTLKDKFSKKSVT